MNRFNLTFAIALLCAGFSANALAQTQTTPAKSNMAAPSATMKHHMQPTKSAVRDWKAIDKNHDNLIEPEEMESYLNSLHANKSSSGAVKS